MTSALLKWLLLIAGVLLVALAVVGIFVPLLPTTPLLLLAAACFVRSSDRLYRWLTGHRVLGKYIRDYQEKGGVTTRVRLIALLTMWAAILYAAHVATDSWPVRIVLVLIAIGTTLYLLSLKTVE